MLLKFLPLILAWGGIGLVISRRYSAWSRWIVAGGLGGFIAGGVVTFAVSTALPGETSFMVTRSAVAGLFLLFSVFATCAMYRAVAGPRLQPSVAVPFDGAVVAGAVASLSGLLAGLVAGCRLPVDAGVAGILPAAALLFVVAGIALIASVLIARCLPSTVTVSPKNLITLVVALILFSSSSIQRLDLFSPLTMKVMKFIHDFVHQFFESMLIPDHAFFRADVWEYIGFLFSNGVGFWGGVIIWFAPFLLMVLSIGLERLPSVAHIRQGAARRLVLAAALRDRRRRLLVAAFSFLILSGAVYESRNPAVEYWDPKPIEVSSDASGEIVIPVKGEVSLDDGKLHKYLFRKGGREARFFILKTTSGRLTVDLDACSICKPDGYGQATGSLVCYYCKTLIPLETIGKPGGCNPVPVPFSTAEEGVRIDGPALLSLWGETVQATARVKKGGGR